MNKIGMNSIGSGCSEGPGFHPGWIVFGIDSKETVIEQSDAKPIHGPGTIEWGI